MFHQFDEQIQQSIILVAMKDFPSTYKQNNQDLEHQAKARDANDNILKEKNMGEVIEEYIDALYYHHMYT